MRVSYENKIKSNFKKKISDIVRRKGIYNTKNSMVKIGQYNSKELGLSIAKKLESNANFNMLEFKQLMHAYYDIIMMSSHEVCDGDGQLYLTRSIFSLIYDCYILSCTENDKSGIERNNYFYEKSDDEFTCDKKSTLIEIAKKTKMKYINDISKTNGYINHSEFYLRAPLVWLMEQFVTDESLDRFNSDFVARAEIINEIKKYINKFNKNNLEIDKCLSVADHCSKFIVSELGRKDQYLSEIY
jgi:hypothetical protein